MGDAILTLVFDSHVAARLCRAQFLASDQRTITRAGDRYHIRAFRDDDLVDVVSFAANGAVGYPDKVAIMSADKEIHWLGDVEPSGAMPDLAPVMTSEREIYWVEPRAETDQAVNGRYCMTCDIFTLPDGGFCPSCGELLQPPIVREAHQVVVPPGTDELFIHDHDEGWVELAGQGDRVQVAWFQLKPSYWLAYLRSEKDGRYLASALLASFFVVRLRRVWCNGHSLPVEAAYTGDLAYLPDTLAKLDGRWPDIQDNLVMLDSERCTWSKKSLI
jgi:hypothetical protein